MKRYLLSLVAWIMAFAVQAQAQIIAPDFTKADINGSTYTLYNELAQGRAVLLDFFRVYCHACQETVPFIEQLAKDYNGRLTVWKLDINNETQEQLATFKKQYGSTVTTFNNCRADFIHYQSLESIAVAATPTFVLIRPDRTVVRGWVGYHDTDIRTAIDAIALPTSVQNGQFPVSSLNIFPSPTTNETTLQCSFTTTTDVHIDLFDAVGTHISTVFEGRVAASETLAIAIPTASLASGTYFLRFRGTEAFFTRSFVVAR